MLNDIGKNFTCQTSRSCLQCMKNHQEARPEGKGGWWLYKITKNTWYVVGVNRCGPYGLQGRLTWSGLQGRGQGPIWSNPTHNRIFPVSMTVWHSKWMVGKTSITCHVLVVSLSLWSFVIIVICPLILYTYIRHIYLYTRIPSPLLHIPVSRYLVISSCL